MIIFALLGFRETLGEHEVYAAEPAREMLDGGSWLLQPFAGAYRTKKPPGQSWLIAASLFVTQTRNEYTARLPSAIAATGLALLVGAIGARLAGRRVGLIAGLMTLTCHAVQVRARLAEADMALALAVALSYAGLLWPLLRSQDGPPRARFCDGLLFWLALAFAFVLKGPIAFGFVLLPVVTFLVLASFRTVDDSLRDARRAMAGAMLNPIGIVVGLVVIVGWPLGALMTYPPAWEQWKHELFDRAAGNLTDASGAFRRDPIYAYVGYFSLATLPWTPFAIVAGVLVWRRYRAIVRESPATLLLGLWGLVGGLFLTLIAFKRLHYALPAIAPLVLLCAWGFDRTLHAFVQRRPPAQRRSWAVATLATWFIVVGTACVVNQALFEWAKDPADAATREFAEEANSLVPAGATIWLAGVGEDRTVWYLRPPFQQLAVSAEDPFEAQVSRLPGGVQYVLCRFPAALSLQELIEGGSEILTVSESYRAKRGDEERRAIVRISVPETQRAEPAGS